jgi:Na+-transporting NADH:ubiquinone oxidoreductase subunit A
VSSWLPRRKPWGLGTNLHGEERAMVLTGNYDKVVPLNIMVDYLVRAVLAGDTDEAISLGILETAPEDFALCDFICPSKIEVQEIIRKGLRQIEEEGI